MSLFITTLMFRAVVSALAFGAAIWVLIKSIFIVLDNLEEKTGLSDKQAFWYMLLGISLIPVAYMFFAIGLL